MKKLFLVELKRAVCSPLFWLAACILIVINVFNIVLSTYGFPVTASSFLFYNTPVVCICLSIFIPLHIGQEFEVRTMNNKMIAGYSRSQIYMTEMMIAMICGCFLLFADICSIMVLARIATLRVGIAFSELWFECIICFICITAISKFFTMITMVAHKQLKSIAIALGLTIAALQFGGTTVSALKQEAYYIEENGAAVENVLYIDGYKRKLANGHVLLSPFAQVKYHPDMRSETKDMKSRNSLILKNAAHHWEFPIVNVMEMIIFTQAGLVLFKKQDFK